MQLTNLLDALIFCDKILHCHGILKIMAYHLFESLTSNEACPNFFLATFLRDANYIYKFNQNNIEVKTLIAVFITLSIKLKLMRTFLIYKKSNVLYGRLYCLADT